MSFSPTRAIVFGLIGLTVGFILSALAFAVLGRPIEAPAVIPYALLIAAAAGTAAGFWKVEG